MKIICLVSYLLFVWSNLGAQDSAHDLWQQLERAENDSTKIVAYNGLIKHYIALNPDSANYYANAGIDYALAHHYPVGEGLINTQLGVLYQDQGSVDIAKERISEALRIYTEQHYDQGISGAYSNLGAIEAGKGNYDVAARYFFNALKLQDQLKDYRGLMISYLNLGELYMQENDTVNSSKYLALAEEVSKKTPVVDQTISVYNTIGVLTIARGDTAKGLDIFMRDLQLSDKPGFANSHVECLLYIGEFYMDKKNPEKALQYLNLGLKTAEKDDIPEIQGNILLQMAQLQKEKNPSAAMNDLVRAKAIGLKRHDKSGLVAIGREMADIYKRQGNFKDAYLAEEQVANLVDTLNNANSAKIIAGIGAAYGFETNIRIRQLEELRAKNEQQRNIVIVIAAAFLLLLIILFWSYQRTIKLNRQMAAHEKELKELNSTKDKLFSIIGHDLRGPIARIPAILDIYDDPGTNEDERKFLLDSLKEHTKSSLETFDKLLYWGLSLVKGIRMHQAKMNPKGLITESIELKKMKANEKSITVTDNTPADIFVFADLTHFDFIIRNLLANALKYTYDNGHIEINADTHMKPGFTVFSVKDDGMGIMPEVRAKLFQPLASGEGTANEKGHGIGLMLCKEFAVQNGGDLWVESEPGKGATFFFSVKAQRTNG